MISLMGVLDQGADRGGGRWLLVLILTLEPRAAFELRQLGFSRSKVAAEGGDA